MSITAEPSLQSNPAQIGDQRVVSIDIFRGVTMAVMIFVNALSDVRGLPWWTYHAHAEEDVMTYVDMVFPFFLFIIGMSLPLSITRRLRRNPSMPSLGACRDSRCRIACARPHPGKRRKMRPCPNAHQRKRLGAPWPALRRTLFECL